VDAEGRGETLTLSEILTEVYARGVDYLAQDSAGQTRAKLWVNQVYTEEICGSAPWPFLETVATGTSPLSVTDLQDVLYVMDTTNHVRLESSDLRDLIDRDVDATTTTGNPNSYYFDGSALTVYPASSGASLSVRYIKTPAELVNDTDEPIFPSRFHYLIVEGAMKYAYRDSDNYEAAEAVRATFESGLARMKDAMFSRNLDDVQFVQATDVHDG
jgi:hypothetical protein